MQRHTSLSPQDDPEKLFKDALTEAAGRLGVQLDEGQINKMWLHYALMIEANRRCNLTRITEPREAAVKHYADSLATIAWAKVSAPDIRRVADIGAGAGLPSLALAIARTDWQITAVESTLKKARFIERCVGTLALVNAQAIHTHSSHWSPSVSFDLVVFRSLAKLAVCLRQVRGLIEPGTWIVAYKTATIPQDELAEAERQAAKLRLKRLGCWPYRLQSATGNLDRVLVSFHRP